MNTNHPRPARSWPRGRDYKALVLEHNELVDAAAKRRAAGLPLTRRQKNALEIGLVDPESKMADAPAPAEPKGLPEGYTEPTRGPTL